MDRPHFSRPSIEEWICRENINHIKSLTAKASSESERKILADLLAAEQRKLEDILGISGLAGPTKPRY